MEGAPDAFLERRFRRASGQFEPGGRPSRVISKERDRAVRHLDAFSLVADDIKVVTTVLYQPTTSKRRPPPHRRRLGCA